MLRNTPALYMISKWNMPIGYFQLRNASHLWRRPDLTYALTKTDITAFLTGYSVYRNSVSVLEEFSLNTANFDGLLTSIRDLEHASLTVWLCATDRARTQQVTYSHRTTSH
jgi:hypothetical protein